jgi:hypothetical protein
MSTSGLFDAGAGAFGADACGNHQRDPGESGRSGDLSEGGEPHDKRDGGLEAHERAERGGSHPLQGEQLETERNHRQQQRQPEAEDQQLPIDATDRRGPDRDRGDDGCHGHRHRQRTYSGHFGAGSLRQHYVARPAPGGTEREAHPQRVRGAVPRLGQRQHARRRNDRPQPGRSPSSADCNSERADELQRTRGSERQSDDGGHEQHGHPGRRDPEEEACPQREPTERGPPGSDRHQHDTGADQA